MAGKFLHNIYVGIKMRISPAIEKFTHYKFYIYIYIYIIYMLE
jgi:hypothetical protein